MLRHEVCICILAISAASSALKTNFSLSSRFCCLLCASVCKNSPILISPAAWLPCHCQESQDRLPPARWQPRPPPSRVLLRCAPHLLSRVLPRRTPPPPLPRPFHPLGHCRGLGGRHGAYGSGSPMSAPWVASVRGFIWTETERQWWCGLVGGLDDLGGGK
jgi:hypothetical protein